jgi:hypothetical protein
MAALALALTVSLSGCATTFGTSLAHTKAPAKTGLVGKAAHNAPKVGSCWRGADQHGVPQLDWDLEDDSAPVNCSRPHQLYTGAVLPLPSTTSNIESSQGQINAYVYDPAQQACSNYIQKNLGGPDDQNGRFEFKVYLPSEADWAAGARWVRCDLTVFKVGSPVADPELENLPSFATLKHQIQSDSHQFDLCTNVPGGTVAAGPRAAGAVFASCSGDPQWTFFHYFGDGATDPSYPTPAEFKAQFEAQCAPFGAASGAHAVPWYPTPKEWADGTHGFECWGTSQ